MKAFRLALLTLVFPAFAHARPVVIENEFALRPPPDTSWEILGGFGVAIDGDYALVSAERYVADASAQDGVRHDAAVFIYKRSGSSWNYTGRLGPIAPIAPANPPRRGALAMKDGIAMTITDRWRIFARTGDAFTLESVAGILPTALNGPDIEIDGGRILAAYWGCTFNAVVLRKSGGTWKPEGQLPGHHYGCNFPADGSTWLDIQGNRAAVVNPPDSFNFGHVYTFGFDPNGSGWLEDGVVGNFLSENLVEPKVAISAPFTAFGSSQAGVAHGFGTDITSWGRFGFETVDRYVEPFDFYSTMLERAGPGMFAQRNFSFDRGANIINVFRMNEADEPPAPKHIAALQSRSGASLGSSLDVSGNRVIVNGRTPAGGDNSVRIFELPASYEPIAVRYHDFENTAEGALWQPAPGSTFSIATVDKNRVFRQPNIVGTAAAWLPGSVTTNQAIQAEFTTRGNVASDSAWAGLVTRRVDQNNYYFAAIHPYGKVELKRIKDGVFATLGTVTMPIDNNKKHRLRLESIGSAHRVYFDDRQLLEARDFTFATGAPGIMTNGVAADYDDVIVSPTPFTTIYSDDFNSSQPEKWNPWSWNFETVDGVLRQSNTHRFARISTGAYTDDQIVRARIKPTGFVAENNWVGLSARFISPDFYLYFSLHERDVVALWTRTGGTFTQLSTARLPISVGTWYDVRLEVVNDVIRAFVDDKLILTSNVPPVPVLNGEPQLKGAVGLITYQATADYDDFISYQP